MPVKNTVRAESPNTYFHVYNRGVNRQKIFLDDDDYTFFISLLRRHLALLPYASKKRSYFHFRSLIELNAFCLMPNHYHLLVYQKEDSKALTKLMTSVITAYTMYFNGKYERRGPLFETRYKASPVHNDWYLLHISRYIHLNPKQFKVWPYSSYSLYLTESGNYADIVAPQPIINLFKDKQEYSEFVNDFATMQSELEYLKHSLANS